MRSKWLEYKGTRIFYQDFSGVDIDHSERVLQELQEVQQVVTQASLNSVLVLADFRETSIGRDLFQAMTESSKKTKDYVRKTAVLGVTGIKRMLANNLMSLTHQDMKLFEEEDEAKDWLIS
jgi:hypothetical protein